MSGQSSVAFAYLRCGEDELTFVVCLRVCELGEIFKYALQVSGFMFSG